MPGYTSSAISKCEGCDDIYFGYPEEAKAQCKKWQEFFALLSRNGITNQGAQNQLWARHGSDITRRAIKPEEFLGFILREEMARIGISCV